MDTPFYRADPAVVAIPDGEQVILVHSGNDDTYVISGVGAAVWGVLEDGTTLSHLVEELSARFVGAHADEVSRDLRELLEELSARGLICREKRGL